MGIEQIRLMKEMAQYPKPKKNYVIPKLSEKRKQKLKEQKEINSDDTQWKWFEERRKEMTGVCVFCGGKSEKDNDETYRRSIAHLLAKRKDYGCPSVKVHPENWLELCHFGNSCHTNFDNGIITWEFLRDSAEWGIIVTKFKKIYPFILESEKKNIPEILLKEFEPIN